MFNSNSGVIFPSDHNMDPNKGIAPEYVYLGPFRFVKPYRFTYVANAKERWQKKLLVDAFRDEFKKWTRKQVAEKIEKGDIIVNGSRVTTDYKVKPRDKIWHTVNRIEAPIYNQPLKCLGETDEFIAFLKPASIPIPLSSGYYFNSMNKMLNSKYHVIHRLDKQTSGIIVMGKTKDAANKFRDMLEKREGLSKKYIARVEGVFPEGEIVESTPIKQSDIDRTKYICAEDGKESQTIFRRLWTDGNQSLVEAHPVTGRTHQIRVHLSHRGFPIVGDPVYGSGALELTADEASAIEEAKAAGMWPPDCEMDPKRPFLSLCLHAFHYSAEEFSFTAPLPSWASEAEGLI